MRCATRRSGSTQAKGGQAGSRGANLALRTILENGDKIYSEYSGTTETTAAADGSTKTATDGVATWTGGTGRYQVHSEIGQAPITRFLAGSEVTRPSPDSDTLRLAFTRTDHRTQRKSDGTLVIEGRRFEIPNRYRHLSRIEVRYAGWDLGFVHLVDERTGKALSRLCPQDKTENASGLRRSLDPISPEPTDVKPAAGIAPLLARLIDRQAATGLPPPYLPKNEQGDDT